MMGGSVPATDVWRPASLEALADLFGLLRVVSDPEKTEAALNRIAEAQVSFDAHEAILNAKEADLNSRANDLATGERDLAARQSAHADAVAAFAVERRIFDGAKAVFEHQQGEADTLLRARAEALDAKERNDLARGAKLTERAAELDDRNVFLNSRAEALAARERDIAEGEALLAEKRAKLTAALQG